MKTREEVALSKVKGRKSRAKALTISGGMILAAQTLMGTAWFVALGKMFAAVSEFFKIYMPYFFFAGFVLALINWIIATFTFAFTDNKNLDKTANYVYNTLNFLFYFATGSVFFLVGASVGMPMLLVSMFIDPAANLVKSIYYLTCALMANNKAEKGKLFEQAKNHAIFGLGGAFVSAAFTVLMLVALPVVGAIALGAVGIAAMLGLTAFGVYNVTKAKAESKEVPLDEMPLLPMNIKEKRNELNDKIERNINRIQRERQEPGLINKLQDQKRDNKVKALTFFQDIILDLNKKPIPAAAEDEDNAIKLGDYLFNYKDKNELAELIKEVTLTDYPDAFQSFNGGSVLLFFSKDNHNKKSGKVEECFNELVDSMMDTENKMR